MALDAPVPEVVLLRQLAEAQPGSNIVASGESTRDVLRVVKVFPTYRRVFVVVVAEAADDGHVVEAFAVAFSGELAVQPFVQGAQGLHERRRRLLMVGDAARQSQRVLRQRQSLACE